MKHIRVIKTMKLNIILLLFLVEIAKPKDEEAIKIKEEAIKRREEAVKYKLAIERIHSYSYI